MCIRVILSLLVAINCLLHGQRTCLCASQEVNWPRHLMQRNFDNNQIGRLLSKLTIFSDQPEEVGSPQGFYYPPPYWYAPPPPPPPPPVQPYPPIHWWKPTTSTTTTTTTTTPAPTTAPQTPTVPVRKLAIKAPNDPCLSTSPQWLCEARRSGQSVINIPISLETLQKAVIQYYLTNGIAESDRGKNLKFHIQ